MPYTAVQGSHLPLAPIRPLPPTIPLGPATPLSLRDADVPLPCPRVQKKPPNDPLTHSTIGPGATPFARMHMASTTLRAGCIIATPRHTTHVHNIYQHPRPPAVPSMGPIATPLTRTQC